MLLAGELRALTAIVNTLFPDAIPDPAFTEKTALLPASATWPRGKVFQEAGELGITFECGVHAREA
jgi:hypothetical protein